MELRLAVHETFSTICTDDHLSENCEKTLEKFVCPVSSPKEINIPCLLELHWHLFWKYMPESKKLTLTVAALRQHILRAHVQSRVWGQAADHVQECMDPIEHGYYRDSDGELKPKTASIPASPKAIIEMASCECKMDCTAIWCTCF